MMNDNEGMFITQFCNFTYKALDFQSLLGHPLCMALVRYKWNRLGRYIYFVILFFYLLFVASVTLFTLSTPAPYSPSQILAASKWKENA